MSILGGITRPLTNVAQNSAKAGKIKKISLKIKMKLGDQPKKGDGKQD